MRINTTVFLVTTAIYTLLAFSYPVALAIKLRREPLDRERWLKNTPVFTLYLPFIFSVGVGLLLGTFPWEGLSKLSTIELILAIVVLIVVCGIAILAVQDDRRRPMVEPDMFKESDRPLSLDREIRRVLKGPATSAETRTERIFVATIRGVLSVLGALKPEWMGRIAEAIEEMQTRWMVATHILVVIALIAMVGGLLRQQPPAATPNASSAQGAQEHPAPGGAAR